MQGYRRVRVARVHRLGDGLFAFAANDELWNCLIQVAFLLA